MGVRTNDHQNVGGKQSFEHDVQTRSELAVDNRFIMKPETLGYDSSENPVPDGGTGGNSVDGTATASIFSPVTICRVGGGDMLLHMPTSSAAANSTIPVGQVKWVLNAGDHATQTVTIQKEGINTLTSLVLGPGSSSMFIFSGSNADGSAQWHGMTGYALRT